MWHGKIVNYGFKVKYTNDVQYTGILQAFYPKYIVRLPRALACKPLCMEGYPEIEYDKMKSILYRYYQLYIQSIN